VHFIAGLAIIAQQTTMQRTMLNICRTVPRVSVRAIRACSYATTTKNAEQNKNQQSQDKNPAAPPQPKAPVEEPGKKPPVYAGHAPTTNTSQTAAKSTDTRHAYSEGVTQQDVQGEASGVQQERSQDQETVKPSKNQNPRGLQGDKK